jgi:hypothetical protein
MAIKELEVEEYIEYTCEWADELMQKKYGKDYEKYVTYNVDGNTSYTEEGQDIFNDILSKVEQCFNDLNIYNKGDHDAD